MSLQQQAVSSAQFQATIERALLAPSIDSFPFVVPLNFGLVTNLNVDTVSYTPSNDINTLRSFASLALAPSFIMLQCDLAVNLRVTWAGGGGTQVITDIPISKFFFAGLVPPIAGSYISSIQIIGQTAQEYPMAQGQAVNITLVTGTAVIN